MADPTDDDDDEDLVPIKRQPKMLSQRKSLPSVDGALDDFIVSANQKLLDVTEFTAENREQQLRAEIAELENKLAAAQKRIENHVEAPPPEPVVKRSWGMVIAAFVVGGGIAFGAAKATQTSANVPVASRECSPAPAQPAQVAAPTTPPAQPQQAAATPPTAPTPAEPPATPATPATPTTAANATVAAKQAPKQPKTPKTTAAATTHEEHHDATQPAQTPKATDTKPPPTRDGSGSDLYNPF